MILSQNKLGSSVRRMLAWPYRNCGDYRLAGKNAIAHTAIVFKCPAQFKNSQRRPESVAAMSSGVSRAASR